MPLCAAERVAHDVVATPRDLTHHDRAHGRHVVGHEDAQARLLRELECDARRGRVGRLTAWFLPSYAPDLSPEEHADGVIESRMRRSRRAATRRHRCPRRQS